MAIPGKGSTSSYAIVYLLSAFPIFYFILFFYHSNETNIRAVTMGAAVSPSICYTLHYIDCIDQSCGIY